MTKVCGPSCGNPLPDPLVLDCPQVVLQAELVGGFRICLRVGFLHSHLNGVCQGREWLLLSLPSSFYIRSVQLLLMAGCITLSKSVKQDMVATRAINVYPCQQALSGSRQAGCKVEPLFIFAPPIHCSYHPEVTEVFCQRLATILHLGLEVGSVAVVALIRLVSGMAMATVWMAWVLLAWVRWTSSGFWSDSSARPLLEWPSESKQAFLYLGRASPAPYHPWVHGSWLTSGLTVCDPQRHGRCHLPTASP